jgi:hypothetical protein
MTACLSRFPQSLAQRKVKPVEKTNTQANFLSITNVKFDANYEFEPLFRTETSHFTPLQSAFNDIMRSLATGVVTTRRGSKKPPFPFDYARLFRLSTDNLFSETSFEDESIAQLSGPTSVAGSKPRNKPVYST